MQRKFSGVLQNMQNFSGKFESQSKKDETILAYLLQNLDEAFDEDDDNNYSTALKDYFKSSRGQKDILSFLHEQQSLIKQKMEYFKVEICVLMHKTAKRDLNNVQQYLHKKLQACKLDLVFAGKKQGKVLTGQTSQQFPQSQDKKNQQKTQIEDYLVHIPHHQLEEQGIKPIQNIDEYDAFYFQGTEFIPKQYLRSIPQAENQKYILFLNSEPYNSEAKNALNIPYLKNIIYIKQPMSTQVPDIINLTQEDVFIYIYNCQYCRQQGNQDQQQNNSQLFNQYQGQIQCDICQNNKQCKKYYIFKHNLLGVENDSLDYKYYNLHRPENIDHMIKFACGCLNKDQFSNEKVAGSLIIGIKDQPPIGMNNRVVCQGLDQSDTDFEHLKNSLHQKVEKYTTIYHQDPNYVEEQLSEQVFNNHFELNKCEIIHYDRKKNCLSELYLYMPEERKFSKKCIIEFHVQRIQVSIQDPVILYLPKGKRDKQIFCQRVLDSTSKTEEFKSIKDFQHKHPQKQILHHDGKINFVKPSHLQFDEKLNLCFYKAVPQTELIQELRQEVKHLKNENAQLKQELQDKDDSSSDTSSSKSNTDIGFMPDLFNDSFLHKQASQLTLNNKKISLQSAQSFDDDQNLAKNLLHPQIKNQTHHSHHHHHHNNSKQRKSSLNLKNSNAQNTMIGWIASQFNKKTQLKKKHHTMQNIEHDHKHQNDLKMTKSVSSSPVYKKKQQKDYASKLKNYSQEQLNQKIQDYNRKVYIIQQLIKNKFPQSLKQKFIQWLKQDPLSKILFIFTLLSYFKFKNKLK